MNQEHDLEVIPPDWQEDIGIMTSAYGPEEAGYLDDVVGHPPVEDDELPSDMPAIPPLALPLPATAKHVINRRIPTFPASN